MVDFGKHQCLVFFLVLLISTVTFSKEIVWHKNMDRQRNMPVSEIPLPAGWELVTPKTEEDPNMIGPGGVKVFYRTAGTFFYSNDPYLNQQNMRSGRLVRQPISAQQVIEQEIEPNVRRGGLRLESLYPLPEIAKRSQEYNDKIYKSTPARQYFDAVGSEWTDPEGKKVLMIVDQVINDGGGFFVWFYTMNILEAPPSEFQNAKKALIYSIVNTRDNPRYLQAQNQRDRQRSGQNWRQHNARMQQNQRNFEQGQALHRSTTDAINNSINSTYESQNAASERSQARFNNYLSDENTVTNPYNGQQYQVESGSEQYWINNDGEYIHHDDHFYNPNADPDNVEDWQLVEPDY